MIYKDSDITSTELQKLIAGCVACDRRCQRTVYELYAPSMMALCERYSKNQEEAEEVLQDGFILVFRFIHQFKNLGSFGGWIRKIIINCALKKYRRKYNGFHFIPLSDDLYRIPAEHASSDPFSGKDLIRMIQQLPPACRMVFNLYVFEGLKHREIADMLGITEGTSKSNLFDARSILKKQILREMKIAR